MTESIRILPSARRHGVADRDMLHVYRHPVRIWELDDGLLMMVGPDTAARMLEVGVVAGADGMVVVHAMRARPTFLQGGDEHAPQYPADHRRSRAVGRPVRGVHPGPGRPA